MTKALVIVESPAKAKTIEKFLGKGYRVTASMGHIRDLPKSKLGIDIEKDFTPNYIIIRGKGEIVQKLREEAKKADRVFLATDPDREGEAISWHIAHLIGLRDEDRCRVTFNEITRDAIQKAFKEPRPINKDLVNAQQARRVLDRLVGYNLSPLLWRKVRRGLSAGRVQSVAVRLICDREEEIEAFQPEEYWTLAAYLVKEASTAAFAARYYGSDGKKAVLSNKDQVDRVIGEITGIPFTVQAVKEKEKRRTPAAPFTTSSLQQEASRKLGFSVSRTMRIAQELYEGVEVAGEGSVGLVTYIRTDSTRVSAEAIAEAKDYIEHKYGAEYSSPRVQAGKSKGAQDAHEAIRPTHVSWHPEDIKASLSRDQYRLYKLIWERFIASQMSAAVFDTVTVDIVAGGHLFRASGQTMTFPGFMSLYVEGQDDEDNEDEEGKALPDLTEGDTLTLQSIDPKQHFTEPPPRYTEAMLVKTLEEKGIGRPSTYVPIIGTIQERGYVTKENKRFKPTELGRVVTGLLKEHFPDIVNVEFTAGMENHLDEIEEGRFRWSGVIKDFYNSFAETLKNADKQIERVKIPDEVTDEVCENCNRPMVIKVGRYGKFLACSGYPECRNTKPLQTRVDAVCPRCDGQIVERRSRKGRKFYGCSKYPQCDFVSWARPEGNCPKCGSILVAKGGKGDPALKCSGQGCDYVAPATGGA